MFFMASCVIDVRTLHLALNNIKFFYLEMDDFAKLTLINNECEDVIDFNSFLSFLPVGSSVTLLPI